MCIVIRGHFCVVIAALQIGSYMLNLVDTYAGGLPLLICGFAELALVSYIYGIRRFLGNIREMLGDPPNLFYKLLGYPVNPFWWLCWCFITPAIILARFSLPFFLH